MRSSKRVARMLASETLSLSDMVRPALRPSASGDGSRRDWDEPWRRSGRGGSVTRLLSLLDRCHMGS